MTTTATATRLNGLDLNALRACITACESDPAAAQTTWTVRSRWAGGTRSDHAIGAVTIGGQRIDRAFTLRTDEPHALLGNNQYANPQDYLLSALNACMMVGYAAVAALMGIELTKLEVEIEGDIDLRGFLGLANVPRGYPSLRQTVRIAGTGTPEQFRTLHETVQATSPNFWNVTRPVAVTSDLVIE